MKRFSSARLLAFTITITALAFCPQAMARTTTTSKLLHRESSSARIAIFAGSASGNPPDSPEKRVDPNTTTSPYAGVGSVGGYCTGVVIAPIYVLTAGHCSPGSGNSGALFFINTSTTNIIAIPVIDAVSHPSTDLAILKLSTPVPAEVPIYSLSRNPLQSGTTITLVGYGRSGYGDVGVTIDRSTTVKRVGQNVVDLVSQDRFTFDFDGPDASSNTLGGSTLGNDIEAGLGVGDSGSPSFIATGNTLSIVGINTSAGIFTFGQQGSGVQIYNNLTWIDSTLAGLPFISSFTPSSRAVGAPVILSGLRFTGTTAVQFNNAAATNFTVNSDTQITAIVPSGAVSGPISVTNPSGTASTTNFTVIPTAQGQALAVSQDPAITLATSTTAPTSNNTISSSAVQYFANGSTFPAIVLRNLLDFYGLAIPKTEANIIRQIGSTGFQPTNSPRLNYVQYNYCGTGDANGTATFTGTATTPLNACSFVAATSNAVTIFGAPYQAPTILSPTSTAPFVFPPFPDFPIGPSATNVATTAPLFTFSDAAASTSALSSADLTNYANNKKPTRGNPVQVPVFFGAVVPALNAGINNGVSPNLTTVELCKVFDRQITNFNQIASTATLNLPIKVVIRSDSSGTTSAFTAYLASACANAGVITPGFPGYYLTTAVNSFPKPTATSDPTAGFIRRLGDDRVSDFVAANSGTFGYVQSTFVQPYSTSAPILNNPAPIQVALQNPVSGNFITANASTVQASLGNINLSANATYPCVLTATGLPIVPTAGDAYPIVTQTYALTYANYATQAETNVVKGAFSFTLGNINFNFGATQTNDQITKTAGLVLLGKGTDNNTINPLRIVARGCINNSADIPTGFSPASGRAGTAVNIIGNRLSASTAVNFRNSLGNLVPASSVTLNSDGSITAIAPSGVVTGPIRVGSTNTTSNFTVSP
jgi:ABC-type phosphate transport system substrate-binding protein